MENRKSEQVTLQLLHLLPSINAYCPSYNIYPEKMGLFIRKNNNGTLLNCIIYCPPFIYEYFFRSKQQRLISLLFLYSTPKHE